MKIPVPSAHLVALAMVSSLFLMASRFVAIFPVLYLMGYGHRGSLLPAINLSQLSEFSLVIASLGSALGHIDNQLVTLMILIFVITSTASTYMIQFSYPLYRLLSRVLTRLGVRDIDAQEEQSEGRTDHTGKRMVFLGFFREASSMLHELELRSTDGDRHLSLDDVLVIDFNPEVHAELRRRGIHCIYGDIAHMDTLHHAEIHPAELIVSTIPDAILKGTTNARLLEQMRRMSPQAKIVVTAEGIRQALDLYRRGADYVLIPRLHAAPLALKVIEVGLGEGFDVLRAKEIARLEGRNEFLP
jgi:TrkA-N domain/Sodium/hydrogen exchanger family